MESHTEQPKDQGPKGGPEEQVEALKASQNGDSGNLKYVLFKVLSALKHFYSFKELEERLGVSAQILWRYVSLRSVPERETAEKLIRRIESTRLLEDALSRAVDSSSELWQLLSSPGILSLIELRALEAFRGEKVNAVVSASDGYSAAIAAVLAELFNARLCVASRTPYSRHILVKSYKVSQEYYETLMFPKECIPRRGKAIVVATDLTKTSQLAALIDVVRLRQSSLIGIVGIVGDEAKAAELARERLGSTIKVVSLFRQCESAQMCVGQAEARQERVAEAEG